MIIADIDPLVDAYQWFQEEILSLAPKWSAHGSAIIAYHGVGLWSSLDGMPVAGITLHAKITFALQMEELRIIRIFPEKPIPLSVLCSKLVLITTSIITQISFNGDANNHVLKQGIP